jgi:hypothetical protein
MSPVFEEYAFAVVERVERIHPIRPEARERQEVVGADQHVY